MADEVPSPAARRAVQTTSAERDGLAPLPWQSALYDAVRALEARLNKCRRENARLMADISQLNARLYRANQARERWQLRQQAWHRERADGDQRRRHHRTLERLAQRLGDRAHVADVGDEDRELRQVGQPASCLLQRRLDLAHGDGGLLGSVPALHPPLGIE